MIEVGGSSILAWLNITDFMMMLDFYTILGYRNGLIFKYYLINVFKKKQLVWIAKRFKKKMKNYIYEHVLRLSIIRWAVSKLCRSICLLHGNWPIPPVVSVTDRLYVELDRSGNNQSDVFKSLQTCIYALYICIHFICGTITSSKFFY